MDAILEQLQAHGSLIVGVNVFLQQLGLPIPSVPTMMVAGAVAARGHLNGIATFAFAVVASLVADLLWFSAGRRYGYPVLRFLCRVSLSPDTCVRETEGIFERWGFFSVVVSKFVPGFSTVGPPIAGALKMPFGAFAVASLASAALWVGAYMGVGYVFARQIDFLLAWLADHAALALMAVVGALASYIGFKAFERYRLGRYVDAARITIDELRELLSGDRVGKVIDVRSPMSQAMTGRIPGAITVDPKNIRVDLLAVEPDSEVIIYCACPNEESARRAAQILLGKGLKRVRPLVGGLNAWMEAGHAVEHGIAATFTKSATSRA